MLNYKSKYLKYKTKYILLKNTIQKGGAYDKYIVELKNESCNVFNCNTFLYNTSSQIKTEKILNFKIKEFKGIDIINFLKKCSGESIPKIISANSEKMFIYISDFYLMDTAFHNLHGKRISEIKSAEGTAE